MLLKLRARNCDLVSSSKILFSEKVLLKREIDIELQVNIPNLSEYTA